MMNGAYPGVWIHSIGNLYGMCQLQPKERNIWDNKGPKIGVYLASKEGKDDQAGRKEKQCFDNDE